MAVTLNSCAEYFQPELYGELIAGLAYGAKNVRASPWISSAIGCSVASGTVRRLVEAAGSSGVRSAFSARGSWALSFGRSSGADAVPLEVGGLKRVWMS